MGKLIRCITDDGAVMGSFVDTTDIVNMAEGYHKTSAVVTAALGRLLTDASMMGNMLKTEGGSVTLRVDGEAPAGTLLAVSDSVGNVRGYVTNPIVELPLNEKGKLDVGGAVGTGTLTVIKDLGMKEPYVGQIPLATGEIAEDITAYYAVSEQIPTVCALGALVNPDLSVKAAGGFIIQLLPGALESDIEKLEESLKGLESVTKMMSDGKSVEDIAKSALKNFEYEVLCEETVAYECKCSRERTESVIKSLSAEDIGEMVNDGKGAEVVCHFCNKKYNLISSYKILTFKVILNIIFYKTPRV